MVAGRETLMGSEPLRQGMSLAWQFLLMALVVLALGMGVIGVWVSTRIAADVTRNTAIATAFYVDSIIAPLTQDLASPGGLGEGPQLALRETLEQGVLGERLASFKLWKPDGTVVYSSSPDLIGRTFPITDGLRDALSGTVHAELDSLDEDENREESESGLPLLEIYSPVREPWSGRVIGVAEFYEVATEIEHDIASARLRSWFVVGGVTLAMLGLLFVIVARGSRLINRQRDALDRKVEQLSQLLLQNDFLRHRVQIASNRTAMLNERSLRRISADLHDGPGQLLAFALLRLKSATAGIPPSEDLGAVRTSLDEAMREIRNISRGAALPELDPLTPEDVLHRVTAAHDARSGTSTILDIPHPLPPLKQAEKICLYRFVQEALNNATRHGGGARQDVSARMADGQLSITVSDDGKGFDLSQAERGLGLMGLEERIAGLGGEFDIESGPGKGTRLTMRIPLANTVVTGPEAKQ